MSEKNPKDAKADDDQKALPKNNVGRVELPKSSPAAPAEPQGDAEPERIDGQLTRKGMAALIAQGQSVVLGGRSYTREQDLPTDEQIRGFREQHTRDLAEQSAQLTNNRVVVNSPPKP